MIDRDFIEKIEEMAGPDYISFNGIDYATQKLFQVIPPRAEQFQVHTLGAILDYCEGIGRQEAKKVIIHIASPTEVKVFSPLDEKTRRRERFISATCLFEPFRFDSFMGVEEFVINLQAQFVLDDAVRDVLKVVGNITESIKKETSDDGMAQSVTAKQGVCGVQMTTLPKNPVTLQPYRTFAEAPQPCSDFILRLKSNRDGSEPRVALFEADGGAWRLEAIEGIKTWFDLNLESDLDISVLA